MRYMATMPSSTKNDAVRSDDLKIENSTLTLVVAKLANLHHGQKKANVGISTTQSEAEKLLNVSTDSVQFAKKVIENAAPELSEGTNEE